MPDARPACLTLLLTWVHRILGYLNLPMEGLDLPYQIFVFADDDKPLTSSIKISFDKMGWVEKFREFKARIGIDRDDQWSSEISLWGTRPFSCSWPDSAAGCTTAALPRGFLKLKIGKIQFGKIIDAILPKRRKERKNRLFNFDLIDTTFTLARSPPGDFLADSWE